MTNVGFSPGPGGHYFVQKIAPSGDLVWQAHVNSEIDGEGASAVAVSSEEDVYVTGGHLTLKFNSSGTQLWARAEGNSNIALDGAENVYLAGSVVSESGDYDVEIKKLSKNGDRLWGVVYAGSNGADDYFGQMLVRSGDGIYVVLTSNTTEQNEFVMIKYVDRGRGSISQSRPHK